MVIRRSPTQPEIEGGAGLPFDYLAQRAQLRALASLQPAGWLQREAHQHAIRSPELELGRCLRTGSHNLQLHPFELRCLMDAKEGRLEAERPVLLLVAHHAPA
jgi:hypothetical protein